VSLSKNFDEIDVTYTLNVVVHTPDDIYDIDDINRLFDITNVNLYKCNINLQLISLLHYGGETWFNVNQDAAELNSLTNIDVTNFHVVIVDKLGDDKDFQRYVGYTFRLLQYKCNVILLTCLDTKILLHELGHALGLTHSEDPNNYMFHMPPSYNFGHFTQEQIENMHWNLLLGDRKISPRNIILHDNHPNKMIFNGSE